MADHDDFNPSTPSHDPSPESDLGALNFGEPGGAAPIGAGEGHARPEAHEALFKHPHPAPRVDDDGPRHPVFPMLLGAAMVLSLVVAWIVNAKPVEPSAPATTDAGTPAPPAPEPATPDHSENVKALQAEVDGL